MSSQARYAAFGLSVLFVSLLFVTIADARSVDEKRSSKLRKRQEIDSNGPESSESVEDMIEELDELVDAEKVEDGEQEDREQAATEEGYEDKEEEQADPQEEQADTEEEQADSQEEQELASTQEEQELASTQEEQEESQEHEDDETEAATAEQTEQTDEEQLAEELIQEEMEEELLEEEFEQMFDDVQGDGDDDLEDFESNYVAGLNSLMETQFEGEGEKDGDNKPGMEDGEDVQMTDDPYANFWDNLLGNSWLGGGGPEQPPQQAETYLTYDIEGVGFQDPDSDHNEDKKGTIEVEFVGGKKCDNKGQKMRRRKKRTAAEET